MRLCKSILLCKRGDHRGLRREEDRRRDQIQGRDRHRPSGPRGVVQLKDR